MACSSLTDLKEGVLQGSLLSLILFLIYMADIPISEHHLNSKENNDEKLNILPST
jgi:MFS superfamily sulfate permease-like transporter